MINFFVTTDGRFGIENYVAHRGRDLDGRVQVVTYDALPGLTSLPATGTIFAAVDQLAPATREAAQEVAEQLQAAGARVLNQPERVLARFELLTRLYDSRANVFRAVRAGDDVSALRYPVFIRSNRRHSGSHTPLLHDAAAVDAALARLVVRGRPLDDLLVVEFCDTRSPDGFFRKYSAMRIGDVIMPRHLHVSTDWVVKSDSSAVTEALIREELDYIAADPHARWLRQVFDLARIDYGRIDYGVFRGEPQVWEINTNPTFARGTRPSGERRRDAFAHLRETSREAINRQTIAALSSLELPAPARTVPIAFASDLSARLVDEVRATERAAQRRRLRGAVTQHAVTRAVKEVLRPALVVVAGLALRFGRARR